jgi:hypothetical protein
MDITEFNSSLWQAVLDKDINLSVTNQMFQFSRIQISTSPVASEILVRGKWISKLNLPWATKSQLLN